MLIKNVVDLFDALPKKKEYETSDFVKVCAEQVELPNTRSDIYLLLSLALNYRFLKKLKPGKYSVDWELFNVWREKWGT